MKVLRKLLAFVVVLALLGGGVTYALTPNEKIKSNETLANVKSEKKLSDLNQDFIRNINYGSSKLITKVGVDNEMFLALLKDITKNNVTLQNGSYRLVGDSIEAKIPMKLGLWTTQLASNIKVVGTNNKIELVLENAKIGKVSIPNFALEKYLKEILTGSGATVNGNIITLSSSNLPVMIDNIEIKSGIINLTASVTNTQLLQYGGQALRNYIGS
ncbi:hypothetical protein [Gemella cuniculi]|uniref:hypothetical protein n=1 Tax=Gemella cuniculi TaxID=150240 RepID=UPI000412E4CE|nr:hypothetical protein [Gemella cuniculi]